MAPTPNTPEQEPAPSAPEPEGPDAGAQGSSRRPSRRTLLAAGALAGVALAGGGVGAATTAALAGDPVATTTVVHGETPADEATPAASRDGMSVGEIYHAVADGIVEITVTSGAGGSFQTPFGEEERQSGQGSGFVYDDEGRIVTNHHVVANAESITVTLPDGSSYDARLLGSDPSTDLAVLQIDASADELEPLTLGDSDTLSVGDEVVAIGSPFGLEETVTSGIVSAVDRRITAPNGFAITDAIQTDAAINQGNSGGPLLNDRAEVVGVNSQIETETGGNVGIGFAVPSNTIRAVVDEIVEDGSVEHAYLGVALETVPADVAEELGEAAGVAVAEVRAGSPAADAGLEASTGTRTVGGVAYPVGGDVVTAVDGEDVETAEELQSLVADHEPGDEIELTVVRDGETRSVTVTLGTRPR